MWVAGLVPKPGLKGAEGVVATSRDRAEAAELRAGGRVTCGRLRVRVVALRLAGAGEGVKAPVKPQGAGAQVLKRRLSPWIFRHTTPWPRPCGPNRRHSQWRPELSEAGPWRI